MATIVVVPLLDGQNAMLTQSVSDALQSPTLPSGPALANPSASAGLSAKNGTAITAMRSDGAPAIDQSIAPTWTGAHTFSGNDVNVTGGNMKVNTVGKGLQVKGGSNARIGSFTLSGGSATVANTSVTANSRIFYERTGSSLLNIGLLSTSSQTAGVGFSVSSANILDNGTIRYLIVEET